jgi:hypothetical protein
MSSFESGGNGYLTSGGKQQSPMFAGLAPGADNALEFAYIPTQPPHIQQMQPAMAIANDMSTTNALPSRMALLQEAVQLSSKVPSTRDEKMDLLLSMMTSMFKLMLLDQVVGQSGGMSPLSLHVSSSNTSGSSGAFPGSPFIEPVTSGTDAAHNMAPGHAAAHFMCPVCPSTNAPITEKSFKKHIEAWKTKVRGGVARRKDKPESCPGIRCLSHPLIAGLRGDITERVDHVVDTAVSMLTPGANAAHTPMGTGNFQRVQQYFESLTKQSS